ncbi:hypothetical protein ACS0TY_002966 [Phlomoides rotata]
MSIELGGGGRGGGAAVSGGPSNLHLKKELTQIRKAARVLRDPGTSSSWRSPINSSRSLTKHHYVHHHKTNNGNNIASSSQQLLQLQNNNYTRNGGSDKGNTSVNVKDREKRVFLYNWRSQKSENERSKQIGEDDVVNSKDEEGSFSTQDESGDLDSLSDARNVDSRSETYLNEKYPSAIFRCKDTDFTPSIMRNIKKKSKRSNYSSASLRHHHNERLQKQMPLSRRGVEGLPGLGSGREDLVSLVDHSDDTEDYTFNSEDLRRASALSPLLARLKQKGWAHSPTKLLRSGHRKEDDSISYGTPALSSSSHNNKYGIRNPSTVESWDATTGSLNDADDEVDDQLDLPGRQGCGIPCYWSRRSTPKSRVGHGSCCSPSLSDSLIRKGSSIFCGSQSTHQRRRHHRSSLCSNKRRTAKQSLVPLLKGRGGSSMGSGNSDDELSKNLGELDLEALSRLDGRRWSTSCRSQEGLELVALNGGELHEEEGSPENARSLSHKYRPIFFDELIGQNVVVQSLTNAVSRGRIAPVYLFQGPRGTGKTSTARIFAAALNCLATEEIKPCGVCRECADFISGKSKYLREVDGSNEKGINKIKNLLKSLSAVHSSAQSQFKVFVVDQCHLLPSKTWLAFLRLLEKPLPHVVFILITTDIDNVPRTIMSRCQKHIFNKISNADIVSRIRKIATEENLDVESDALELIASNADGSIRDAETMIDQLSLFGKRITVSLVNELIGVVSDEKLLDLLELAMSSNATETVIKARELMDTGVDPMVLMSQLATLIVDIIAGTYPSSVDGKRDSFFGSGGLSERELERLKHALTLLSEAEKHLRASSERSTWFTATLLQLGSVASPDQTHSGSSRRQSSKATEEDRLIMLRESTAQKQRNDTQLAPESSTSFLRSAHCNSSSKDNSISLSDAPSFHFNPNLIQFIGAEALTVTRDDCKGGRSSLRCMNSKMLADIWLQCIEKCHSQTLRQLLHSHGRLVSISEVKGGFVAHVAFRDRSIKTRAEGFVSSITNSFEIVLQRNVEVKIILLPDSSGHEKEPFAGNANPSTSKEESKSDIPVKRIESIINEQRLETAWLQATEKGTPGSMSRLKPAERNQVLPQDGLESMNSADVQQDWEDEFNHEIKALKINGGSGTAKRSNHYPISPSLLHNTSSFASLDTMGYESGSGVAGGCRGLFCWNKSRPRARGKAKQGTSLRSHRSGRFSWFGECGKPKRTDNRHSR